MDQRLATGSALLTLCLWLGPGTAGPAFGGATGCPDALAGATRLVVISTRGFDAVDATLRTFERDAPGLPWKPRTPSEPAVVGKAGLGWGLTYRHLAEPGEPLKREGDQRAPAGIFGLGASFGFAPADRPGYLRLEDGVQICVDDPDSPFYSRIVDRAEAGPDVKGEDMPAIPLYRRGIVVDYPTSGDARAGSCIFVHIWEGPSLGTSGCVAAPEPTIAVLQDWAGAGGAAIAILPETARERFGSCLPQDRGAVD